MTPESMTLRQARRVALAAQGFADRRPTGRPDLRHVRRVIARVGLLQIDSVNVLQRAHYLPLYSRLGSYPTALLDRAVYHRPAELFEYWGHEASLLPVATQPLLRWRMADHERAWRSMRQVATEQPELVQWVRDEIRDKGPVTAAEIEHDVPRRTNHWGWNWSTVKMALEWLFWRGEVCAADRTSSFARRYDLPSRVLPAEVLATPTPAPADAYRELVAMSARALGVAAEVELRDYYRLPVQGARTAIAQLVEQGVLIPTQVQGWRPVAYRHVAARAPRTVPVSTLVSPFDPLVWERSRTERLFGFRYRIEIYVPAAKRVHGYYVLPFLHDERLVARVDLKADRRASLLVVPAAWIEPGEPPAATAAALALELRRLADWLGLGAIIGPERGDLAAELRKAIRSLGG